VSQTRTLCSKLSRRPPLPQEINKELQIPRVARNDKG
jgi:hypothetical protein